MDNILTDVVYDDFTDITGVKLGFIENQLALKASDKNQVLGGLERYLQNNNMYNRTIKEYKGYKYYIEIDLNYRLADNKLFTSVVGLRSIIKKDGNIINLKGPVYAHIGGSEHEIYQNNITAMESNTVAKIEEVIKNEDIVLQTWVGRDAYLMDNNKITVKKIKTVSRDGTTGVVSVMMEDDSIVDKVNVHLSLEDILIWLKANIVK